ncbi:hypothetical protein WJX73_004215 [Symbiochloris irregularis]|uniref:Nucleotide-diphospho-sugar transferase domain-containing protein n=1 Tax=Symbiochloris irregularis TaxID=706552 RepID=A0AAW1P6J4_9CHLO
MARTGAAANSSNAPRQGHMYVFSKRPGILAELRAAHCQLQYSTIMAAAPGKTWRTPENARNSSIWTAKRFKEAYRRMGHWRLTFQLDFATTLGYPYILQLDLDSYFPEPVHGATSGSGGMNKL